MDKEDKFADEIMSDEELDGVAGGSCYDIADDSRMLNVLLHGRPEYHQCDRYGWWRCSNSKAVREDVKKAWASLGIEATLHSSIFGWNDNKYSLDGKEISRSEAWAHAQSKVGRTLTEAEWNW